MKYSEEIVKIVKEQNFKSFWHCLDFLIMAGYPLMEAFGIALHEFGESKIFSDVAFIRVQRGRNGIVQLQNVYERPVGKYSVSVGMIDESNIHLAGLYGTYRKWMIDDVHMRYTDVEETCEIINVEQINNFLLDYLLHTGKLHYGFEPFKYDKEKELTRDQLQSLAPEIAHMREGAEYLRMLQSRQIPNNNEPFR